MQDMIKPRAISAIKSTIQIYRGSSLMENKQIEAIINATFPGLMFFCQDLDLDEPLIVKYKPEASGP